MQDLALLGGAAAVGGGFLAKHSKKSPFGKDAWGDASLARKIGIMEKKPKGTVLGMWGDGSLLSYNGDQHQLITGESGSGKTAGPIISSLLTWRQSALINDPKGELYRTTARFRSTFGTALFWDPVSEESARHNPLYEIRVGTSHEIGDIDNVVKCIIDPGATKEDKDYFEQDAERMMTGLILFVLHDCPPQMQNLATINRLVLRVDATFAAMRQSTHTLCADLAAWFDDLPDRQKAGVYGTVSSKLGIYNDPLVAKTTSVSDFQISDLVCSNRPVSLYMRVRMSDKDRLLPLRRMMLRQVTHALMYDEATASDGRKKNHHLLYCLEEFPEFGKMKFFTSQLDVMRSHGATALIAAQSVKHIIEAYGQNQTIVGNCKFMVCYATNDDDTLKAISIKTGTAVEQKESISKPASMFSGKGNGRTISTSENRRPLMEPSDVMQLPDDEQLIFRTGCKPFKTKKVEWFKHPDLRNLGTNDRRGGIAPGQNQHVLEALKS